MKHNLQTIILLLVIGIGASCKKDNFEPPASKLSGRVVYQDQPVGVRSDGVQLELWQRGFQLFTKVPVFVAQDGTFSASLFDGEYLLTRLRGNGPWVDNTDTIRVQVSGNTTVDVPVQPFFIVKTQTIQKSGAAVTVSAKIDQIVATAAIERVSFYIGRTEFVDANFKEGFDDKTGADLSNLSQPLTLSITPSATVAAKGYVYGRVGVKTVNVPEMAYGPVQKIQL
jgi:hypothetical protein